MKVIFLDIDGVLNNDFTKEKFRNFTGIDVRLASLLRSWLIRHPDVSVVLSSTWRLEEEFRDEVKRNGVKFKEVTPDLRAQGLKRGFEIEAWLNINPSTQYVILDDYGPDQFLAHQRPFLVQTSPIHGLRNKNLGRIENLMGSDYAPTNKVSVG